MDSFHENWTVTGHTIPAAHIRGFTRAVRDASAPSQMRLAVNQYTPKRPPASDLPITLILHAGVGSSKESFEPFLDHLLAAGCPIRSAWIPDAAWHGASYALNAPLLGDDIAWDDAPRDLLHMINTFQAQMPPPLVGIGHSWGGYVVTHAALAHPRLFSALVLGEPWTVGSRGDLQPARSRYMARMRDAWPSREAARADFARNPYYAAFPRDVFERVVRHEVVDVDADDATNGAVRLATPKALQAGMMLRLDKHRNHPRSGWWETLARDEPRVIMGRLPELRPPVLYVSGTASDLAQSARANALREHTTGIGEGGSGGTAAGKVESVWVEGANHAMFQHKPREVAELAWRFVRPHVEAWKDEVDRARERRFWVDEVNPEWLARIAEMQKKEAKTSKM